MITIIIRYGNHESNITLVCILDACVNLQIIFGNNTFEKIEGTIKNGQSRETANTGHTRHRTKTTTTKTTTQKTKKISNTDPQKAGVNPRAREEQAVHFSYKTHGMLLI